MGFFGEFLFGSDSKKRAMSRLKLDYLNRYGSMATDIERAFDPIIAQVSRFREQNIGQYRSDMQSAMRSYSDAFERAQREYATGMGQAITEMKTGRDSTIEMLRQTVARQQQATTARNAFTGLGGTTFGQQQVVGIGTQGALQEGVIREQYAQQLSALEAQRAAGMSGMTMQYGGGMSAMGSAMAAGSSNAFMQYGGQINALETARLQAAFGARSTGLAGYFGASRAGAALQGSSALGGPILSAFGSAFGSWANQGFANPFQQPPMNAGVNTGQVGVYGNQAIT